MIKQLFFGLFLFTLCTRVSAQKNNIEYGFQSGVNLSSAYGDNVGKEQNGIIAGLHIGGHIKVNVTNHFGVKAILAYHQTGSTWGALLFENSTATGLVAGELHNKLNYLNLPVLAEYSTGKKVKFNVNAGVFAGYLLKYTMVIKTEEPGISAQRTSPGNRKAINFGVSAGTGIQIPIATTIKLDIGLQDNLGLSNTYKQGNGTAKINSFTVMAGLTFALQ
ncbi:porin family protein [Ferruginibacter sp. SUN106]|uniref:porin family protein n=1 Tax=Ferruginibacter sp. SUN106 TaxID=2978348 RepID=UPI003D3646BE